MTSLLRMQLRQRFHTLAASLALLVACGGSNSDGLFNPVGGASNSGGAAPASGGATSFGGAGPNGGSAPTGGSTPNGGSPATGGTAAGSSSGGTSAGGSSGGAGSGGSPAATGGSGVGGSNPTTGGTPSTGGGGSPGSGGTDTGGSSTTGGVGSGGDPGGGGAAGSPDAGGADAGGQGGAGGADGCQPSPEICDGIDNDCNGRVDNGVMVCPTGCKGVALNGKGYMFCLTVTARTQQRASAACASNDMHLAWIETAEENAAIAAAARDISTVVVSAWIGASDEGVEGEWRWVEDGATTGTQFWSGQANGSAVGGAYANWGANRPDHGSGNEDCVAMTLNRQDFQPGQWDDEPCTSSFRFICEAF